MVTMVKMAPKNEPMNLITPAIPTATTYANFALYRRAATKGQNTIRARGTSSAVSRRRGPLGAPIG